LLVHTTTRAPFLQSHAKPFSKNGYPQRHGFDTDFDHRLRDGGLTADLVTSDIWLLLTPDGHQLEYLFTTNEGNQTYHQVDTSGGLVSERGHWRIEAGELVVSVHEFVDEKIDPPQEFKFAFCSQNRSLIRSDDASVELLLMTPLAAPAAAVAAEGAHQHTRSM
jgi:hypothetical protein